MSNAVRSVSSARLLHSNAIGLLLSAILLAANGTPVFSKSLPKIQPQGTFEPAAVSHRAAIAQATPAPTPVAGTAAPLRSGTYFFGRAQARDQLGVEYMVVTVSGSDVVGAFYMPASSFDCFYGQVDPSELALTVVDSYEQAAYPYALALETAPATVAGTGAGAVVPAGFYAIEQMSELEHQLLATCQAMVPGRSVLD